MQFETWWLLAVPVLFALGWMAARIDLTELLYESKQLPRSYFNGLNFLLNDQPDRAIEAFIEVVKLDPETIERHFALGSLFRRRGETERAIRVHRNLLERPDLPVAFRDQAMFSLAQDYLKAGLLDRAESSFKQLAGTPYEAKAWHFLGEIYQIESDWPRAIEAAGKAGGQTAAPTPLAAGKQLGVNENAPRRVAHYWCELAQVAMAKQDWPAAETALATATASDAGLLRITQLRIGLAQARGDAAGALAMTTQAQAATPSFAPLLVPMLLRLRPDAHRDNAALLQQWFDAAPAESVAIACVTQWRAAGNADEARRFAASALQRLPTLALSAAVLEQKLQSAGAAEPDQDLLALVKPVKAAASRERRYECSNCGFRATQFYWQCPGCKQWETLPYDGM
jgi:lipopolysaccharide assembly protein B